MILASPSVCEYKSGRSGFRRDSFSPGPWETAGAVQTSLKELVHPKLLRPALLGLLIINALPAAAQPAIYPLGVKNAASYRSASSRGQGLAPGSIFVVKGAGLGPAEILHAAPPYPARLPDEVGGARITITPAGSGASVDAAILYAWEWQVAGILPSDTPLGPADVTVSWQGKTSEPQRVEILPAAVGLFTQAMNGRGPGVIQNYKTPDDQPLNSLTRPGLPGQYLILWATGLGAADNSWFDRDVEVELGDLRLRPSYAGPAPGYPGLDQINVRLPNDGSLPEGCYTKLSVSAGDYTSPPVLVSTARQPGACKHPMGLSPETLARLDAGGRVPLAQLSIQTTDFGTSGTIGGQHFASADARLFATPALELPGYAPPYMFDDLPMGCAMFSGGIVGVFLDVPTPLPPPAPPPFLSVDAGERLKLTGPAGRTASLTKTPLWETYGRYSSGDLADDFFTPGIWTVTAPGGADAGPFTVSVRLPPAVQAVIPEVLVRTENYKVTWDTTGYVPGDRVAVRVSSTERLSADLQFSFPVSVLCLAAASSGAVTVPADLLQNLRSPWDGQVNINVLPAPEDRTTFVVPGIEYGSFTWTRSVHRMIEIK